MGGEGGEERQFIAKQFITALNHNSNVQIEMGMVNNFHGGGDSKLFSLAKGCTNVR